MSSDPTEKPSGDATQCFGGDVHVYHSSEGDRWARLCMITTHNVRRSPSGRADVLLSPAQATMVASAMEKEDPDFLCVAKGMLWCQRHPGAPRTPSPVDVLGVLGAECAFGNGSKEVDVTSEHLRQIAAALRAASAPPSAPPDGAGRRTDDNLRRVFGYPAAEAGK
jgi:hypothetical protein